MTLKICKNQQECGLDILESEALGRIKIGLVEVVHEWARGLEFKKITELTEVQEGITTLKQALLFDVLFA